jgi:hypothetical protein
MYDYEAVVDRRQVTARKARQIRIDLPKYSEDEVKAGGGTVWSSAEDFFDDRIQTEYERSDNIITLAFREWARSLKKPAISLNRSAVTEGTGEKYIYYTLTDSSEGTNPEFPGVMISYEPAHFYHRRDRLYIPTMPLTYNHDWEVPGNLIASTKAFSVMSHPGPSEIRDIEIEAKPITLRNVDALLYVALAHPLFLPPGKIS